MDGGELFGEPSSPGGEVPAGTGTGGQGAAPGGTTTGGVPGAGGAGVGAETGTGATMGSGGAITGQDPTGGSGGGTTVPPRDPGEPIFPDGRGPSVNFVTYEAEDMGTNGQLLGPTRQFGQVAAEASGRKAVRLAGTGNYVEFENESASNSIVVRYSIPDGGHDYWTTLTVLVNGQERTKLNVTSRYTWTYGGHDAFNQPWQEDPGAGNPHHFFDETRALIGDVPVGATVRVEKSGGDGAAHYDIDLVEMEQVPPPLPRPGGSISLTDCGAVPNDNGDDSAAIQGCIDWARDEGRVLWIPEGTFNSWSSRLSVGGVKIQGAGMWYSNVAGYFATFDCFTGGCEYRDFSVLGDTIARDDEALDAAFGGNGSSNVVLERIWVEHTRVGYWTGPNTNNIQIRECRFRSLHADGVNLFGGTKNSIVEQNHARGTGDDAFAAWSAGWEAPNDNNVFRHNYVQAPWKANCFALYGGNDSVIEDNVCADVVQYPGVLLARSFDAHAFSGMTRIERNTLIRAGGWAYGQPHGAIKFHANQGPLQNVTVTDLDIYEPTHSAVHVQGEAFIDSLWLNDVTVHYPGETVFFLNWGSHGALDAVKVVATGAPQGIVDDSGSFNLIRGAENSGW